MPKANMDPRSLEFLSQIGIKDVIHNPKKINKKVLSYFDYFLAVDLFVLNALNRTYPKYMKKFKLVNAQFPNIDIIDPYTFKEEDYIDVLLKIEHISQNIDLENIRLDGRVVMQRPAKPFTPVRFGFSLHLYIR